MKIGNIKIIVKEMADQWRKFKLPSNDYEGSVSFEYTIKGLPKKVLDDWFQKRFNKNTDYDQWVGIRDTLDSMGYTLYEKALTVIGDAILVIQAHNQEKINDLEGNIKEKDAEIAALKKELSQFIDTN